LPLLKYRVLPSWPLKTLLKLLRLLLRLLLKVLLLLPLVLLLLPVLLPLIQKVLLLRKKKARSNSKFENSSF
jgi:hypothetical protein